MSKIARVKFIRDKEPNIKALTAENKVLDGALYVATDTGTLWMGISSSSLIQIKDNINTNTTYNLTKSGNTITLRGSDGSTFNVTDSNTVYGNATTSAAGLMSAADKAKLDGVAAGSNHVTVDAELSTTSTNPVQNKVIKSALDGKSNTGHTHDDRYYTESEINTKLNAKANSSHTHTKAQITDFPTSMPASDVPAWAKAASKPSYTIGEVSGNLAASRISGTINAANLPSYVDDVLEYASLSKFPTTGESGKIYTALDTNKIYRWSGSAYVVISETISLGTTHATAGYGDESHAAYTHSTKTSGNPHHVTKTDVGLGNVENKSSATIRGELTSANVTTALGYTPPKTDTNTHYTTRVVAGAANGTANAATTNGNTHINVTDDNTFRSGVVIKGAGATSVTSDASGNITVQSTDINTWRPIQNNLTSTATDQSLSAAQGKALNDKFSSYVPTSRTVNGKALSANITLSAGDVGAAASSHSHNYAGSSSAGGAATKANGIVVSDTRNNNSAPKDAAFDKNMLTADFKYSSKIGAPTGFKGEYCGVLSLAPWSKTSGGHGYQLAFGYASAGHPRLALRGSDLSATAWNSWYKIYTSDDKPTLSELGAAAASHSHTKSQITDFAHTHDDRYYTESEMNTKLNDKAASDVVTISSTKPTSNTCKIWIKI